MREHWFIRLCRWVGRWFSEERDPCPKCHGACKVFNIECDRCCGRGYVPKGERK